VQSGALEACEGPRGVSGEMAVGHSCDGRLSACMGCAGPPGVRARATHSFKHHYIAHLAWWGSSCGRPVGFRGRDAAHTEVQNGLHLAWLFTSPKSPTTRIFLHPPPICSPQSASDLKKSGLE